MGKITLYGLDGSPPVRACLLTLKALNIPFEYVIVNLSNRENFTKEYLAKNPQHTIPTLEDDGHVLWDSHAIIAYLVSKYGKDDSLYPKDLLKRALVDQRLHFESGVVFQGAFIETVRPIFYKNENKVPQSKIDAIIEAYNFMETFLKDHPYMAGDKLTIADFSLVSTATSMSALAEIDASKYPKLTAWIKRLEQLPYYEEANGKGARFFGDTMKSKNLVVVP